MLYPTAGAPGHRAGHLTSIPNSWSPRAPSGLPLCLTPPPLYPTAETTGLPAGRFLAIPYSSSLRAPSGPPLYYAGQSEPQHSQPAASLLYPTTGAPGLLAGCLPAPQIQAASSNYRSKLQIQSTEPNYRSKATGPKYRFNLHSQATPSNYSSKLQIKTRVPSYRFELQNQTTGSN